jgi:hypothetical protein
MSRKMRDPYYQLAMAPCALAVGAYLEVVGAIPSGWRLRSAIGLIRRLTGGGPPPTVIAGFAAHLLGGAFIVAAFNFWIGSRSAQYQTAPRPLAFANVVSGLAAVGLFVWALFVA